MTPQEALDLYHENEELNAHSDNYLLLAKFFQDDAAIKAAELNLCLNNDNFDIVNNRKRAHDLCNPYYYELVKLCK